jgi:hypothetical protein
MPTAAGRADILDGRWLALDSHRWEQEDEGIRAPARARRQRARRCYAGREVRPGEEVDAEAHVRATARGFFHPTGTCALRVRLALEPPPPRLR